MAALISKMKPLYILSVLAVGTLDRMLVTFKWVRLLRSRGLELPLLRGMKTYCASQVWGLFLPAPVGADAIRAFSVSRTPVMGDKHKSPKNSIM